MRLVPGRLAVSLGAPDFPGETQVRVAEHDERRTLPPSPLPFPWTVAWLALAVAVPFSAWVLLPLA